MLEKINMLGMREKSILLRFKKSNNIIVIQGITKINEKNLDKRMKFNTGKEYVNFDNILLYGVINFDDENDINLINEKNIIDEDIENNRAIANMNYKTGDVKLIQGIPKIYEEIDPVRWLKFHHCLIGNPERIIIYKTNIKFF